jgi:HK97 family phage major capsid protein
MKKITLEELQKNLQSLANQKGSKGFAKAKALYMEDVMVMDAEGNPVDPAAIDIEISMTDAPVEAMMDEKPEDAAKSIASEVRSVIRDEISKGARTAKPVVVEAATPVYGRARYLKSAEEAYNFGRWAMACMGSQKSAQYCADKGIRVTKGHVEGINTAGGFLVPDVLEPSLINLRDTFGVARQQCRIVPMGSDVLRMPRRTGTVSAYFVGEAAAGTESQQAFDQVALVAKKLMVLTTISSELNEDNIVALGDNLAQECAYAMAKKEDECLFEGDGTSTYGGIVGCKTACAHAGATSDAGVAALSSVTLTHLRAVVGKLAQWADGPNAKWYVRRSVWNSVFLRLAEGANGAMLGEIMDASTQQLKFYGYDVVLSEAIASPSDADGQTYAYFGDMSLAAYLGDRRGLTVEFSNAALNAFEQDEIAARATERFDLNVANVGSGSVSGALIRATL